jgi:RNA polymerase sigma-70 factor, ECF subfamily
MDVHNLARDEQRRHKRRPTEALQDEHDVLTFDSKVGRAELNDLRPTPEQRLLEREKDARLKAALKRLPEGQRHCLHLRAQGLKYREIGEVLDVGTSTVAEWIQKGLKQLERDLA